MSEQFKECYACKVKPGAPDLCGDCLKRRKAQGEAAEEIRKIMSEHGGEGLDTGKSRWTPGKLVRLKSGGPMMVACGTAPPTECGTEVYCIWFDDEERVHTVDFPDVALEEAYRPDRPHLEGRGFGQSLTDEEFTFVLKALNARRASVARGEES